MSNIIESQVFSGELYIKASDHHRAVAAAVAAEREACAKFIEHDYVRQFERPWRDDLSAAIRARGQP
jgi:hypothetical protein